MRCKKRNKRTSLPLAGTPAVLHIVEHDQRPSHTYSDFMFKIIIFKIRLKIFRRKKRDHLQVIAGIAADIWIGK